MSYRPPWRSASIGSPILPPARQSSVATTWSMAHSHDVRALAEVVEEAFHGIRQVAVVVKGRGIRQIPAERPHEFGETGHQLSAARDRTAHRHPHKSRSCSYSRPRSAVHQCNFFDVNSWRKILGHGVSSSRLLVLLRKPQINHVYRVVVLDEPSDGFCRSPLSSNARKSPGCGPFRRGCNIRRRR